LNMAGSIPSLTEKASLSRLIVSFTYSKLISSGLTMYFYSLVFEIIASNYDLQVRIKWNKNDLAIWDK
jgi:hypothetical protein